MHGKEHTQLAKLGFADRDKNSLHDEMCEFLAENTQRDRLCTMFGVLPRGSAETEVPLNKGAGQYQTTIGFLDVVYPVEFVSALPKGREMPAGGAWFFGRPRDEALTKEYDAGQRYSSIGKVIIEVKTTIPSCSDVIRQIKLYREYARWLRLGTLAWVLVVPESVKLKPTEQRLLRGAGIYLVTTAASFEEWRKKRREATPERSLEI